MTKAFVRNARGILLPILLNAVCLAPVFTEIFAAAGRNDVATALSVGSTDVMHAAPRCIGGKESISFITEDTRPLFSHRSTVQVADKSVRDVETFFSPHASRMPATPDFIASTLSVAEYDPRAP